MTVYQQGIAQSTDDAQSNVFGFDDNDTYYPIADFGGTMVQGWRFQSIDIAQATVITSAELEFKTVATCGLGHCEVDCYGYDIDDVDTWSTPGNKPNDAWGSKTTAFDSWDVVGSDVPDHSYFSREFDVTAIVQEILDRPGWNSGNNMGFLTQDAGTTFGKSIIAYTWDHAYPEPRLTITYPTVGGFMITKSYWGAV